MNAIFLFQTTYTDKGEKVSKMMQPVMQSFKYRRFMISCFQSTSVFGVMTVFLDRKFYDKAKNKDKHSYLFLI